MHNGAPVQPDAAGCCVGMVGVGNSGYATCASEPALSGTLFFEETREEWTSFTCDRHGEVLSDPRPLTAEDVDELERRLRVLEGLETLD